MKQFDSIDGFSKGDWVRFYKSGTLVIGQIEYLFVETGGFPFAATEHGKVSLGSVLESRTTQ